MPQNDNSLTAQNANAAVEEALIRLERAILDQKKKTEPISAEQASYMEELENKNKQLSRDAEEMKKHCIALKTGYEALEKKYKKLEKINESAEKALETTIHDIDQIIAQKSLH
ncbi:MAG: hypothetical protein K9G26_08775 [Emcibacter sp.]|nr:hypothetical protein [Emcibacter sp.]